MVSLEINTKFVEERKIITFLYMPTYLVPTYPFKIRNVVMWYSDFCAIKSHFVITRIDSHAV